MHVATCTIKTDRCCPRVTCWGYKLGLHTGLQALRSQLTREFSLQGLSGFSHRRSCLEVFLRMLPGPPPPPPTLTHMTHQLFTLHPAPIPTPKSPPYSTRALRLSESDEVELCDGEGATVRCAISSLDKRGGRAWVRARVKRVKGARVGRVKGARVKRVKGARGVCGGVGSTVRCDVQSRHCVRGEGRCG